KRQGSFLSSGETVGAIARPASRHPNLHRACIEQMLLRFTGEKEVILHAHSRRGFLARMLGAAWSGASLLERAALVAAQARAQSRTQLPTLFEIEKVADGIYAGRQRQ